ncbi:Cu2+-exporting ATPase [Marinobacter daqiaonensis]|uniref:Cu2+-exporting ATPase n=1 Tax=Marinobacter daqiaonensis TaxID=650891 RepID=A0A1I6H2N7_9GAMM|nr:heavy metal translocating P-type ATPase [Marinobacter daqiaonensis]SFR48688.1 Cu2+-exporting ATPase [Marinobacter daqiaonensis]
MADIQACYHCSEPVRPAEAIVPDPAKPDRAFCCHGCRAVFETIHAEGLDSFYQHRTEPAVTPRTLTAADLDRLRQLDHPAAQESFVYPVKGGQEAQLLVGGITCAACIWLLEKHIGRYPGVISFTINHSTQRARLVWSPEESRLSDILTGIHELGYTASPYHADEAEEALKAESRSAIIRLCVAGIGTMQTMMLAVPLYFGVINDLSPEFVQLFRWFSLLVATPVVLYSARPFFTNAVRDIRSRHLTMDVPVATAIGLAYGASTWVTFTGGDEVYFESVCMFTFFLSLGRFIETRARYRAGLTGKALGNYQPRVATRITADGTEVVAAHQLAAGDRIQVKPGETLAVDGIIRSGYSTLNEAALTGEYLPESHHPGDKVFAGSVNGENPLEIEVQSAGSRTRLSGILRILDRVQSEKPRVARMADRIAAIFVSRVLIIAPLVWIGWWLAGADNAFDITLSVLVVTCPCALSLATPTAITSATVRLRRLGFLPTRGHTLESLGTVDTVVFDKTGTLTEGRLNLVAVRTYGDLDEASALRVASGLEQHSEHPIAKVFSQRDRAGVTSVENHLGQGLAGELDGETVVIGHREFIEARTGVTIEPSHDNRGIDLWLAMGSRVVASFVIDDRVRKDAGDAITQLQAMGIRTVMLSGDRSGHVKRVAGELGIDEAVGSASPEEKLERLQQLAAEGRRIMMVGDGLNDLPSMAGATVSVAMGSGTDLTQLRADAVLLSGHLTQLVNAIATSEKTRRVIRQNMMWALGYNLLALPAAAAGLVPPWLAAIGMSASSLVVVLNALRLGYQRRSGHRSEEPTLAPLAAR